MCFLDHETFALNSPYFFALLVLMFGKVRFASSRLLTVHINAVGIPMIKLRGACPCCL